MIPLLLRRGLRDQLWECPPTCDPSPCLTADWARTARHSPPNVGRHLQPQHAKISKPEPAPPPPPSRTALGTRSSWLHKEAPAKNPVPSKPERMATNVYERLVQCLGGALQKSKITKFHAIAPNHLCLSAVTAMLSCNARLGH